MATDGMGGTDGTIKVDSGQTREEQPTALLRFVEREVERVHPGVPRKLRILQQQWQIICPGHVGRLGSVPSSIEYEWRDVPLEVEGLIDA